MLILCFTWHLSKSPALCIHPSAQEEKGGLIFGKACMILQLFCCWHCSACFRGIHTVSCSLQMVSTRQKHRNSCLLSWTKITKTGIMGKIQTSFWMQTFREEEESHVQSQTQNHFFQGKSHMSVRQKTDSLTAFLEGGKDPFFPPPLVKKNQKGVEIKKTRGKLWHCLKLGKNVQPQMT